MATTPKPLTSTQLTILKITYKFRFVTADLIASYRSTYKNASYELLSKLHKNGYLGRRYNSSYKLIGQGARYHLTSKSIKYLREQIELNEGVLHSRYKDSTSTEQFVLSALEAFETAVRIRSLYPNIFTIFSEYELANYSHFPRPLPKLFIRRNESDITKPHEYFIELAGNNLFFIIKKQINQCIEHYESGEWPHEGYPCIIFLTKNKNLKKNIEKYIEFLIDNGFIDEDEMKIIVTDAISSL
ncbi:MAG: hypothetical protein ABIQ04_02470 [Candidatus Saccharimonadales bacterium]